MDSWLVFFEGTFCMLLLIYFLLIFLHFQEASASKNQSSTKDSSNGKANTKRRETVDPVDTSEVTKNKKAHSESVAKITENKYIAPLPRSTCSDGHPEVPGVSAEPPVEKGQSWLQKSSWKNLVEGAKKSSFSITNVLPGASSPQPAKSTADNLAADVSNERKKIKPKADRKSTKTSLAIQDLTGTEERQKFDASAVTATNERQKIKPKADRKSTKISLAIQDLSPEKAVTENKQKIDASEASTVVENEKADIELPAMQVSHLEKADAGKEHENGASVASVVASGEKKAYSELPAEIIEKDPSTIISLNRSWEDHSHEPDNSVEPSNPQCQVEPCTTASQSTKGQSWLQKCSWKDLVGNTGSSSFSITTVLPAMSSLKPTQPKHSGSSSVTTATEAELIKTQPRGKISTALPTKQDPLPEKGTGDDEMLGQEDGMRENKEPQKARDHETGRTRAEVSGSGVCTFMRSEESLKQWSEAKAALSRQVNKKRKRAEDDDSAQSMKGIRPQKGLKRTR